MASQQSPNGGQNGGVSSAEEDIPRLQNVSPTIFVPLERSLLEPFNAPRDKVDRLKVILERTEKYSEDVRRNLMYLFLRERDRIMQEARRHQAAAEDDEFLPTDTITQQEADAMIRGMMAPSVQGRDYTLAYPVRPAPQSFAWSTTWKAKAVDELLNTIDGAMVDFNGFKGMMAGVNQRHYQAMEREKAVLEKTDSRP